MRIAAVLLAAGLSTRFGGNKIATPIDGRPMGHHAARTLGALRLDARIVVTGATVLDWPGFTVIENPAPDNGLSGSIRLGLAAARQARAEAILIALADMPFVSVGHYERLLAACDRPAAIVASSRAGQAMPPAIFGEAWFVTLEALEGDRGAGALLAQAERIEADPGMLVDIDRPSDIPVT
jgi:molybdenum cofactor cytidylyltransferase